MDRRKFIKIGGATVATGLISIGLQNAVVNENSIKYIPGAGHTVGPETLNKIDKDAFIGLCARCGVCAEVCPFKAIKFKGLAFPQLTDATRRKCPSYESCGICASRCPTDAINEAFKDVGVKPGTDKITWWDKPEKIDL